MVYSVLKECWKTTPVIAHTEVFWLGPHFVNDVAVEDGHFIMQRAQLDVVESLLLVLQHQFFAHFQCTFPHLN